MEKIIIVIAIAILSCGASPELDKQFIEAVSQTSYVKAKRLLDEGADINAKDEDGWGALEYTASKNRDFFFFLLKKGIEYTDSASKGSGLMISAACGGDMKIIEYVYSRNTNIFANDSKKNSRGWTPLHAAVFWARYEAAEWLLKHGADPNKYDYEGNTPLHRAVKTGLPKLVRLVLKYGGDKNLKIDNKYPVIDVTSQGRKWNTEKGKKWREIYEMLK